MCGTYISELKENPHSQRVAGTLIHLFERHSKTYGSYAFATLEDTTGRLEVSIWSEALEIYKNILKKGKVIVIEGEVQKDSNSRSQDKTSYKMVADKIFTFDQARKQYLKHIKLYLDPEKNVEEIILGLKELALNGKGSPVILSYIGSKASVDIELPKDFSVNFDDDSHEILERLFGSNNVDLVYDSRPYIH